MNDKYLFNETPLSRKAKETGDMIVYAPGEMLLKYQGDEKKVDIPEGVKTIESSAFANNYSIESVKLPNSVEIIGPQAFWCSTLKDIEFSSNLIEIGDSAFRGSGVKKIELPSTVKYIRRGAFMECACLKSASLQEGLKEIGHNAFEWCYELKEINIPGSVETFGKDLFDDCKALKKLTCYENFVIDTDTFGKSFPKGLSDSLDTLEKHMTNAAYQKYVLTDNVWSKLKLDTQVDFFVKRNTKGALAGYSRCIKSGEAENFGQTLLKRAEEKRTKELNQALFNFIYLFYDFSNKETIREMYAVLKNSSKSDQLISEIEQSKKIMAVIKESEDKADEDTNMDASKWTFSSYEDIDSFPAESSFDASCPINLKLKKVIVSHDKLKFTVKFQSDKSMNEELSRFITDGYDPLEIIKNSSFEERSISLLSPVSNQEEEHRFIVVKTGTEKISPNKLQKRLLFFVETLRSLQNENILEKMISEMPKKKNGTLFVKRSIVIVPVLIMDNGFNLPVLCMKASKDNEAEMKLKNYLFASIEEMNEFLDKEKENLKKIINE